MLGTERATSMTLEPPRSISDSPVTALIARGVCCRLVSRNCAVTTISPTVGGVSGPAAKAEDAMAGLKASAPPISKAATPPDLKKSVRIVSSPWPHASSPAAWDRGMDARTEPAPPSPLPMGSAISLARRGSRPQLPCGLRPPITFEASRTLASYRVNGAQGREYDAPQLEASPGSAVAGGRLSASTGAPPRRPPARDDPGPALPPGDEDVKSLVVAIHRTMAPRLSNLFHIFATPCD